MSKVAMVKSLLSSRGDLVEYVPGQNAQIDGYYVYMVYNQDNIAQVGHGSGDRLSKCVRGTTAKKHNKAFICALAEVLGETPNRYCYVKVESKKHAEDFERLVHTALGVRTNKDGATVIEGVVASDIIGIHTELWNMLKATDRFSQLTEKEKMMAEELFDVVTYGTTMVKRSSGKIVPSTKGDNLEGNILMCVGKAYLIQIYQKLTDSYHKYGIHKLSEESYQEILSQYTYIPKKKAYSIPSI